MQKVKIYYIKTVKRQYDDKGRLLNKLEFDRYWNMTNPGLDERQSKPLRKDYRLLWEGELKDDITLEDIYIKCQNAFTTNEFVDDRSMMVGDLIEMEGKLYICSPVGFNKTEWKI